MLAAVLYAPGDLQVEERPSPVCAENQAVVAVRSVGVCGSDLNRVMKTGTYRMPLVPGHEFSGTVKALPPGYAGPFQPGARVVSAPIIPCRVCAPCQSGHFGLCERYDYIGSRRDGAMAQEVLVPVDNLLPMPDTLSFQEGAMIEPAAVTLHGMRIAAVSAGDRVCVLGCGTIGLLAVQLAGIMGASLVIASDISGEKRELARRLGADIAVNPLEEDMEDTVRQQTGGLGCDVVIETAGSPQTQQACPLYARYRGRLLLLGTAHREVCLSPTIYERILRKELTLFGSWNSYSAPFPGEEWRACIHYAARGSLNLAAMISHRVSLAQLPETIAWMKRGEGAFVKVLADL